MELFYITDITQGPEIATEVSRLNTPLRGEQHNLMFSHQEMDTALIIRNFDSMLSQNTVIDIPLFHYLLYIYIYTVTKSLCAPYNCSTKNILNSFNHLP
jgi:hypothetical protein